eukprot:287673-Prorocentrum_minimum.AAC.1
MVPATPAGPSRRLASQQHAGHNPPALNQTWHPTTTAGFPALSPGASLDLLLHNNPEKRSASVHHTLHPPNNSHNNRQPRASLPRYPNSHPNSHPNAHPS